MINLLESHPTNCCSKCGRTDRRLYEHHHKGYTNNNDDVVLLCQSCHLKLHYRIRKEGRCPYTPDEISIMTKRSYRRRNQYTFHFTHTIGTSVVLNECFDYNFNTGNVSCTSYFSSNKTLLNLYEEML